MSLFTCEFSITETIGYVSYWGGSSIEFPIAMAIDKVDNSIYVLGQTLSTDFPVSGALKTTTDVDAFISGFTSKFGTLSDMKTKL